MRPGESFGVDLFKDEFLEVAFSKGRNNPSSISADLGRILRRVFPKVEKQRKTISGERSHIYKGLYKVTTPNKLTWDGIMKYSPTRWIQSQVNEEFMEWWSITGDTCNGERVMKELRIFQDLSFQVRLNSRN